MHRTEASLKCNVCKICAAVALGSGTFKSCSLAVLENFWQHFFWKIIVQDGFSPGKHHKQGQKRFCDKSWVNLADRATSSLCNVQHPSPKHANTF